MERGLDNQKLWLVQKRTKNVATASTSCGPHKKCCKSVLLDGVTYQLCVFVVP